MLLFFENIKNAVPHSKILDPTCSCEEFLKELCRCKAVISTAMHPLIACDSLRIPNAWVRISEKTTSRYKFYDYYSVFGIHREPVNLQESPFTVENVRNIIRDYDITDEQISKIQENLLSALKLMVSDLKRNYSRFNMMKSAGRRVLAKVGLILINFVPKKAYRKKLRAKLKSF